MDFIRYPFDGSMKVLGRKWAPPVLMELCNERDRFNTLRQAIPEISPRTLSARLDDLEDAGLVKREMVQSSPLRAHYRLTEKGEDMRSPLRQATSFSLKWYSSNGAS